MTQEIDRDTKTIQKLRRKLGISGRVASAFLESKLTPLLILAALGLGLFSVLLTPREEEPQIQVPMIDVLVPYPGASPKEVEERVATPLEKLLWEIPGVDYVYTTSSPSFGMAIVRFDVGEDPEKSLVKVYAKLDAHPERIPAGAGPPIVRPKSIDDVPIVALTLHSERYGSAELRAVAEEAALEIRKIPNISEVTVIGGEPREIRVQIDPARLQGHGMSAIAIAQALRGTNDALPGGSFSDLDREVRIEAGRFLTSAQDVRDVVVGVRDGRPLRLGEVAQVTDQPAERRSYVLFSPGPRAADKGIEATASNLPAVTIAIAKKPGSNAVVLARQVEERLAAMEKELLPAGVEVTLTRNYGETAGEKSNELILHMLLATGAVVLLMLFALGRREAIVVAVAVPVTLALTLATSALFGYTLNRVTLFALIFAIGILVDDAIVVVENIHRHFQMRWTTPERASVYATDEVGNPTILATFTVIAALLPLAFVSGLMGPYMRPIPINASAAMFFSLIVAFTVTPWVTLRVLGRRRQGGHDPAGPKDATPGERRIERAYSAVLRPLLRRPGLRAAALGTVAVLLLASMSLVYVRAVRVKMLPYDNKSEMQVVIDMPEGSTLERTAAAAQAFAAVVREEPEVTDTQVYVGTASPMNFNGLVRHYYLRKGPAVADIQVNLAGKHDRKRQSHEIAKAIRPKLLPVAERYGARIKVAEVPPGPPVLSTMVAEVYGPDPERQVEIAAEVKRIFETTPGIVDVDWYVEDPQPKLSFRVDAAKAALAGITPAMIAQEIRMAAEGAPVGLLHGAPDREPVPIVLHSEREGRRGLEDLGSLSLHSPDGRMVPLSQLVSIDRESEGRSIYHKNLRPVTYVTGEVAGRQESPIYGILDMKRPVGEIPLAEGYGLEQLFSHEPESDSRYVVKWDGEWQITYEVFRDMGIAFAVVMLLVYILVVAWFRSFLVPLVIMAPIPLTLIGILPGHWATGIFFTATSMIGFIALAGIIVRNSILLVDFINLEIEGGASLEEAVLKAGAVRLRPIVLTAAALVVGGLVIVLDPIFQGLAISLIFGVVVSTALTLVVIPLLYHMLLSARTSAGAARDGKAA
ncbi:MAG: efflux RND transporter permease subunit [Candidatus Eisenbacteria bacterium]